MAQPRNIVFKTNTNDDTVTKLTNVNPVLENNGVDIYWWRYRRIQFATASCCHSSVPGHAALLPARAGSSHKLPS